MGNPVLGIDVVARLDAFKSELAKIPDIGGAQAKLLTASLGKEIRQAGTAAKQAGKDAEAAGKGFDTFRKGAHVAGKSGRALGAALSTISPEAGEAVREISHLGHALSFVTMGGAETTAMIAAALAVLAPFAASFWAASAAEEEEARVAKEVSAAHEALKPILDDTTATMIALAVETGGLTAAQGELEQQAIKTAAALASATKDTTSRINEIHDAQQSLKTQLVDTAGAWLHTIDYIGIGSKVFDAATTSTEDLNAEEQELSKTQTEAAAAAKENREAHEKLIAAKARSTAGRKAASSAAKDEAAAIKEVLALQQNEIDKAEANAKARQTAAAAIAEAERKAVDSQRSDIDMLATQRDRDLAALQANLDAELAALEGNQAAQLEATTAYESARRAIIVDSDAQIAEVKAKQQEEEDKRAEERAAKEAEDQQKALESTIESMQSSLDAIESFTDAEYNYRVGVAEDLQQQLDDGEETLTDAQKAELKKRIAANKKAAIDAFNLTQALQYASAVVTGASAVLNAFNDGLATGGPWGLVIGAAGAAAAAITAGVQIAAIASEKPAFHSGGLMLDEGNATLLRGEGILNRPAVDRIGGPQAVNDINAGRSAGGGVTVVRIGRLEAREIARTDIRAGGILPRTMRQIARNGGNPAGVSGKAPLA